MPWASWRPSPRALPRRNQPATLLVLPVRRRTNQRGREIVRSQRTERRCKCRRADFGATKKHQTLLPMRRRMFGGYSNRLSRPKPERRRDRTCTFKSFPCQLGGKCPVAAHNGAASIHCKPADDRSAACPGMAKRRWRLLRHAGTRLVYGHRHGQARCDLWKASDFRAGANGVGQPGLLEGVIPIWGSGRAAIDDFQNKRYIWGTVNTALAISDIFLVKSLATAGESSLQRGS